MSRTELESRNPQNGSSEREAELQAEVADLRRQLEAARRQPGHDDPLANPQRPSAARMWRLALLALIVIAIALAIGWLPRNRRQAAIVAEAKAESQAAPLVTVARAKPGDSMQQLTLPANIQAVTEAPILARADGYLKRRLVDIGDRVSAGQLLADIEAPELDRQVEQAKAAVLQARAAIEQASAAAEQGKANENLARVTAQRWSNLLQKGAVSRQENDQYQAQFRAQTANVQALEKARAAAESNLAAVQANLGRLTEIQSYKQVRAPFAGIVTMRNIDAGALITSGQTLLYRIAQNGILRAYVNIPQSDAESVHIGEAARLELAQFPGRTFSGTVVRTSSALDPSSRTLLAEVQVPNREGMLMPGMYAQVVLEHSQKRPPLIIPGDTLVMGAKGPQVATVAADNRVKFKSIVIGRDFGKTLEVLQGLENGEMLIANPDDQIRDGVRVAPERESK